MTAGPLHLMDAVPAHTPGPVVQFANVRKRFGRLDVLRGVDLTIARSRITAILGPNGAGKTTLIKCLLGLTRPDEGTMEVGGRSPALEPAARAAIGYAPQAPRFPDNLPGRRILTMLELLRETPGAGLDPIFRSFGLDAELDKPARTLSGGTRQKLSLALALAFRPTLLILDEPTAGLDPVSSGHLKDRLRQERAAGTTVVLTSHLLGEIEDLADDIVFLLDGRVRFRGPLRHLLAITGEQRLERAVAKLMVMEGGR